MNFLLFKGCFVSLLVCSFLNKVKQLILKKWKDSYSSKLILKVVSWIILLNAVKLVRVILNMDFSYL